ncbi:MAG: dephospho-CoA kinase [Chloroflexota bacterium]
MRVIGLTGGIGTGKSTVSRFLSEMGAVVLDADKIGHEAFTPSSTTYNEVVETFGRGILTPEGQIDRRKLGKIVFDSPEKLDQLNRIIHPWLHETLKNLLEGYRRQGTRVVVIEAALLIEAGWLPLVDKVWVTVASRDSVLKRVAGREGISEDDIIARIQAQLPAEERVKYADTVINTDVSLDELKAKVAGLWREASKRQ